MPELSPLPQNQVIRLVAQADRREFALFLGAGASRSSGAPLASEMIHEWRRMGTHFLPAFTGVYGQTRSPRLG